jgi:hypothetical protein
MTGIADTSPSILNMDSSWHAATSSGSIQNHQVRRFLLDARITRSDRLDENDVEPVVFEQQRIEQLSPLSAWT